MPAQEIWFNTDRFQDEHLCVTSTTNACAVGQCLEEAALFALFEAIERDAFLTTWYLRRTCDQITASSVRFEPFQLLWARLRARFPNYRFHFFDICSDVTIPSVALVAVRTSGTGPKMLLTAATHLFAERAMFSALKDLGVSLSSRAEAIKTTAQTISLRILRTLTVLTITVCFIRLISRSRSCHSLDLTRNPG